ncbi:MAG: M14 family metallocarboxypeptidase [Candidatus Peregrinibacteria bacterium]
MGDSIPESATPEQSFADSVMKGLSENRKITLETVCEMGDGAQSYPVVLARSQDFDPSKPTIFISAGMHGDEPAGVHAVIRFLNTDLDQYRDRFNIVALPCLNPSGFDAGTHNTASGLNINDHFGKQSDDAVIQAIEAKIKSLAPSILLALDLHEDNSGDQLGCYAHEMISRGTDRIAHQVLEVLAPTDICRQPEIYGAQNANGVIEETVEDSQGSLGRLDLYLKTHSTQHVMSIETPSVWPLEKRIQAHLAMIHRGLETIENA